MEKNTQNNGPEKSVDIPLNHKNDKNIGMAVVAYILFFVPLLSDAKDDPFVKFHVKQGLVVFIAWAVLNVLFWTPFIILYYPAQILLIILVIIGIMNALHGKEIPLPVIGHFADNFHF
jgi:uncharacterized membrane protein